jgi:holo-[acyl-carrier protein] synthase
MIASQHDESNRDRSIALGVDLVSVRDVAKSLEQFGDRYTGRLFTRDEISYCMTDAKLAPQRFAARFAAKEAVMKALRVTATDAVAWTSIEVRRMPDGWCEIVLHDAAKQLADEAGVSDLVLSMSHERDYATATVIAHRRSPAVRLG